MGLANVINSFVVLITVSFLAYVFIAILIPVNIAFQPFVGSYGDTIFATVVAGIIGLVSAAAYALKRSLDDEDELSY